MSPLASSGAFGQALPDCLVIYLDFDESSLGPTPPDVRAAALDILELRDAEASARSQRRSESEPPRAEADIYAKCSEYLGRFTTEDSSGEKAFLLLSHVSTFFHEARHIHDILSTGWGLDVLLAHFNCYQNALSLCVYLKHLQDRTGSRIPLPIDPALMAGEPLLRVVERYKTLPYELEQAGRPSAGIHQWMGNIHLLEASAGMVQLDILHDLFGDRGVFVFDRFVNTGDAARKYMWLINDFDQLAAARVEAKGKIGGAMAYLLWASLHTNRQPSSEAVDVSPVTYFHALADYVTRKCRGNVEIDNIKLLTDRFDAMWGFRPLADAVDINRGRAAAAAQKLAQGWREIDEENRAYFADLAPAICAAYERVSKAIEDHGDLYFVGRAYSHAVNAGTLPALRADVKINGRIHAYVTRGTPCIDLEAWDKAAFDASVMNLLVKGRCASAVPHLEEAAFASLTGELGLRFSDGIFD